MSKRPSSERDLGEDEAEDLGLQNDIRRMRLDGEDNEQGSNVAAAASSQISAGLKKGDFTPRNVIEAIADVTYWKDLGVQLGIPSARLNMFDEEDEPKEKMIAQWMKDPEASWEKLENALTTPAMCENRVAKGIAERRGSSFDKQSILENQSKDSTKSAALEFTEANVRNAIVNVSSIRELGERLNIPPGQLEDINKLPLEKRKQKLVEVWFKVDPDCNWGKLETAIQSMKVLEWKTSKSMSGSFTSADLLLSPNKSNGSRTSSMEVTISDEDLKFQKAAGLKNTSMIKRQYFRLKKAVAKKLTDVVDDMGDFRRYILNIFEFNARDTIQKSNDVTEVFELLTEKSYWNFMDVYNLESIVEEYGGEVEKECLKLINEYKEKLNGFKAAIKICEFIEGNKNSDVDGNESGEYASLAEEKEPYDVKYRTKLSIKLADSTQTSINISLESLFYVEKLWDSLCFDYNLPSLPHVLHDIVNGSIIIHWIIQHKLTWKILEQIEDSVKFFEREAITNVCLEGVCVYNQKKGIRTRKVCYVKLLITVQEGKEVGKSFIQECFPDINSTVDELGRTALLLAARHGHTILMKPLLGNGADIYHRDKNGDSILSLSKSHNDLHNRLQSKCEAVMITAAKEKDLPLLKRALDFGVDTNAREKDSYGWTALLWACDNSHADVVDFLLQHGADIDAQDSEEWTGLILSSRRGKVDIVNNLLDNGADIHHLTNTQWNALMWAAQEGHAEVARSLLEKGAESVEDDLGFTPLLQASQDGHLGVVKALVEHDPEMDLDKTTKRGWTAIMIATKNEHEDIIRYLVEKGSDVNYQKQDEITALHIAGFKGHNSIVRYFCLAQKMMVDIQDKDGITPLMFAVKQGRVVVVRTLVENGRADVNLKENAFQWTALFFAVNERRPEVLDYLLRSGRVDVNHVDDLGHSIVDLARKVNPDALEYLSKYHKAETETMTRAPPKQFTMAPYQVMLDRVSRTIGDNMDIKARPEVKVGAA